MFPINGFCKILPPPPSAGLEEPPPSERREGGSPRKVPHVTEVQLVSSPGSGKLATWTSLTNSTLLQKPFKGKVPLNAFARPPSPSAGLGEMPLAERREENSQIFPETSGNEPLWQMGRFVKVCGLCDLTTCMNPHFLTSHPSL